MAEKSWESGKLGKALPKLTSVNGPLFLASANFLAELVTGRKKFEPNKGKA